MNIDRIYFFIFLIIPLAMTSEIWKDYISPISPIADDASFLSWAKNYRKYNSNLDPAKTFPVVGILTQPVAAHKKNQFNYNQYILEINNDFI